MDTATKDYWIQTISGKKFSYLDPQPESIFGIAIPVQRFRSCDNAIRSLIGCGQDGKNWV